MALRADPEPKETLAQKRVQLQHYEQLQQDIFAHEAAVESVANAAAAVVAAVGDPQISQQLYNIKHDYRSAKEAVQVRVAGVAKPRRRDAAELFGAINCLGRRL